MSEEKFHTDINLQILQKLPAKTLGRCKCVSKPWRTLVSNPDFVKTHLNLNSHNLNLLLVSDNHSLYALKIQNQDPFISNNAVPLRFEREIVVDEVYASCDGLLLAGDVDGDGIFVLNPTTRQVVKLPVCPLELVRRYRIVIYGFGFDACSDDYKVVTISCYNPDCEYMPECNDMFVDVFSMKTGAWRRVSSSPYGHAVGYDWPGVFVDKSLHYLACRTVGYSTVIARFSLEEESFDELMLPSLVDEDKAVFRRLVVLNRCLCFVDFCVASGAVTQQCQLWMMKEYGVTDSWTQIVQFEPGLGEIRPLSILNVGDVMLENEDEEVLVYNVEERSSKRIEADRIPASYRAGLTCVESLVPIPQFEG